MVRSVKDGGGETPFSPESPAVVAGDPAKAPGGVPSANYGGTWMKVAGLADDGTDWTTKAQFPAGFGGRTITPQLSHVLLEEFSLIEGVLVAKFPPAAARTFKFVDEAGADLAPGMDFDVPISAAKRDALWIPFGRGIVMPVPWGVLIPAGTDFELRVFYRLGSQILAGV